MNRYAYPAGCRVAACLIAFAAALSEAKDDGWQELDRAPSAAEKESVYTLENLELRVFQRIDERGDEGDPRRRRHEAELRLRVERLRDLLALEEPQTRRLHLAGALDLRRFWESYDEAKQVLAEALSNGTNPSVVEPLASRLLQRREAGLLGGGSAFDKVAWKVADEDRQSNLELAREDERLARFRSIVELSLMSLDRVAPMLDSERAALLALAEREMSPPNFYGGHNLYCVYYQFSLLPPDAVREAIPGPLGEALVELFAKGKAYGSYLESLGVYDKERGIQP